MAPLVILSVCNRGGHHSSLRTTWHGVYSHSFINNEAELMDVQSADDDNVPEEDGVGYHTAPPQLTTIQQLHLTQACEQEETSQLVKQVRAHNQAQR